MAREWLAGRLDAEWVEGAEGDDPGIPGRTHPVPKPKIEVEQARSKIRLRATDHINVVDGGTETHAPHSVGYTEEEITSPINVEVRTTANPPDPPDGEARPGLVRFEGADGEDYGGLYGEVKRILELYRLGARDFDVIITTAWNDESSISPVNHYTGHWAVDLDQRAYRVDPPDPLGA